MSSSEAHSEMVHIASSISSRKLSLLLENADVSVRR